MALDKKHSIAEARRKAAERAALQIAPKATTASRDKGKMARDRALVSKAAELRRSQRLDLLLDLRGKKHL
jgi:hypothetical protein